LAATGPSSSSTDERETGSPSSSSSVTDVRGILTDYLDDGGAQFARCFDCMPLVVRERHAEFGFGHSFERNLLCDRHEAFSLLCASVVSADVDEGCRRV
jgi:hypothetical protein